MCIIWESVENLHPEALDKLRGRFQEPAVRQRSRKAKPAEPVGEKKTT
jgi:hypothetical protein